jgi:hypothetical protein
MYPSCGSVLHTFLFGRVDQSKTLTSFLTSSCACFVFYDACVNAPLSCI